MAKNGNTQNTNKKNIAGVVIGSIIGAAGVAFGVISVPVLGVLTFGISALIAGVGLGIATLVIIHNSKRFKNKNKNETETKKQNVTVKATKEKTAENVLLLSDGADYHKNNEKVENVICLPGKVENSNEKPKMEEFLTEEVGPNTFTIYNQDKTVILKDPKNNEMIYNISKDNRFRYALNDFSREFNDLPNCCVVVRDAGDNSVDHNIKKSTFRKDMTELLKDIKLVRKNLSVSKSENIETDDSVLTLD